MRLAYAIVFCLPLVAAQAQRSFHFGALVLDLNTGIEVYNSTNVYSFKRGSEPRDTTVDSDAGNANLSLGLEVGIGRFVGLGVRGKSNTFFRSLDEVTNTRADIRSSDLSLMLNLHPLALKRFDLVLGGEMGLSKLRFDVNDLAGTLVTGTGGYFSIYLNPRFYLNRLGFNLRAALPVFNYRELQRSGDTGGYVLSKWKASGLGVNLGVQFRFF